MSTTRDLEHAEVEEGGLLESPDDHVQSLIAKLGQVAKVMGDFNKAFQQDTDEFEEARWDPNPPPPESE